MVYETLLKSGKIRKLEGEPLLCGRVGVKNQEAVDVPYSCKIGGKAEAAVGQGGGEARAESGLGSGLRATGTEVSSQKASDKRCS